MAPEETTEKIDTRNTWNDGPVNSQMISSRGLTGNRSTRSISNPFRQRLYRRIGGQYRAPQINDCNQRCLHAEQVGVDFERQRQSAIEANQRDEPSNPF